MGDYNPKDTFCEDVRSAARDEYAENLFLALLQSRSKKNNKISPKQSEDIWEAVAKTLFGGTKEQ